MHRKTNRQANRSINKQEALHPSLSYRPVRNGVVSCDTASSLGIACFRIGEMHLFSHVPRTCLQVVDRGSRCTRRIRDNLVVTRLKLHISNTIISAASPNSKFLSPSTFLMPKLNPPCTPSYPLLSRPTCSFKSPPRSTISYFFSLPLVIHDFVQPVAYSLRSHSSNIPQSPCMSFTIIKRSLTRFTSTTLSTNSSDTHTPTENLKKIKFKNLFKKPKSASS